MSQQSNKYWADRIRKESEKQLNKSQKEVIEKLIQLYSEQSYQLKKQITDVYIKMLDDSRNNPQGIMANDIYLMDRYSQLLEELNKRCVELGGYETKLIHEGMVNCYKQAQIMVEKMIPKESLPPTSFIAAEAINPEQAVQQVWCLDGKEFSERIWNDKDKLLGNLRVALADSLARGEDLFEVTKRIQNRFDVSLSNAYRLARTETKHAQIKGQIDKYSSYGFSFGRYYGINCCDDCKAHHGQLYSLKQLETIIPNHPNCTCTFLLE